MYSGLFEACFPIIASWLTECGLMGAVIGLIGLLINMFIRSVNGKERLL